MADVEHIGLSFIDEPISRWLSPDAAIGSPVYCGDLSDMFETSVTEITDGPQAGSFAVETILNPLGYRVTLSQLDCQKLDGLIKNDVSNKIYNASKTPPKRIE